jgi:hypothetical protein
VNSFSCLSETPCPGQWGKRGAYSPPVQLSPPPHHQSPGTLSGAGLLSRVGHGRLLDNNKIPIPILNILIFAIKYNNNSGHFYFGNKIPIQFCGLCKAIPFSSNTIPIPIFATNNEGKIITKLTLSPVKLPIGKLLNNLKRIMKQFVWKSKECTF